MAARPATNFVKVDNELGECIRPIVARSVRKLRNVCQEIIQPRCLLIDAGLPGMSGLQLIQKLEVMGSEIPSIMITGRYDVPLAVQSMKAGAIDFLEKPVGSGELLVCVKRALELSRDHGKREASREDAMRKMGGITQRQREIMNMVLEGHPSKNIAADLRISQRTVENHRASIMKRTGAKSLPALARLAVAAATI